MKITTYIWKLACLTGLALVSACNDTELVKRNVVEEGIPVKVSLNFSSTMPEEVSVGTRAIDAEDPEYRINDLYVLAFGPDGKLSARESFSSSELAGSQESTTETLQGKVPQMTLLTGDVIIYGIANAISRPSEYIPEGEEQNLKAQIDAIEDIDDLEAIQVQLATHDANALGRIAGTRYIMSGRLEGTVMPNGTVQAKNEGKDNTIPLYRTDSHIKFNVSAAEGSKCSSFTLLSYTVHRVPAATSLVSLSSGKNYDAGKESKEDYWDTVSDIQTGGNTLDFYVPENLKDVKIVDGDKCNEYKRRELCIKQSDGENGAFKFAPDNGTYVVLHGIYEGKATTTEYADFVTGGTVTGDGKLVDVRGVVDYTIHLGTWTNSRFDDFSNRRNVEYTYTVHVAGVDDIIVEVETRGDTSPTENEPGAEGSIFFQQGTLIDVDAHNSAVVLEFTAADIKAAVDAKNANPDQNYFQYQVNSPFGTEDNQWLHFRLNEKSAGTYSRMVRTYPGDDKVVQDASSSSIKDDQLLTLDQLMEVLQNIGQRMNSDNPSSYADSKGDLVVTCFINEYYYNADERRRLGIANWGDFTNTSNREAYIFGAINESKDGNSSTILTKYVITQRSIQTMDAYYEKNGFEGMGYGLETFNETGQIAMGEPKNRPLGPERGRANTVEMLGNLLKKNLQPWGYVPTTLKKPSDYLAAGADAGGSIEGYTYVYPNADMYKYASYACLMRNRDENGNGRIDDDEIKWFLPSLDQYAEIFAGLDALSMDSRLYTDPEWNLKHYLTSTWALDDKDNKCYPWIVWSEEGFCTQVLSSGKDYADDKDSNTKRLTTKKREYRCMRYLNDEYDPVNRRQPFYNYDENTRVISFNHLRDGVFRSRIVNDELEEHNGRENANRLYHAFQVAKDYIKDGKSNKTFEPLDARKIPSPCANYSEESNDKGTWRIPNQRELMMMLTAGVFKELQNNGLVYCQTLFSHYGEENPLNPSQTKYGYAVQWQESGSILMLLKRGMNEGPWNPNSSGKERPYSGFIRCVKDVHVPIE